MTKIIAYSAEASEGVSYWPSAFPWQVLKKWEAEVGPISYNSQYLSSPIDRSGNYLKSDWLHYYPYNQVPDYFDKRVMFVDPAVSLTEDADYFAIAIGGRVNNTTYLLDLYRNKEPLHKQINTISELNVIWHPNEIIVETSGQQLYLVQGIEHNTKLNITSQKPKSSKQVKFEAAAVYFNSSQVLIPGYQDDFGVWYPVSKFQIFYDEWTGFPKSKNDDTLDAVCGVVDSLINTVVAGALMEPFDTQTVINNVCKQLELSDQEKQGLEEYLNRRNSIRRNNFNLIDRTRSVRMVSNGRDPQT